MPSFATFRDLLEKMYVADYSADAAKDVTLLILNPTSVLQTPDWVCFFAEAQAQGFGRFKRRALLACLGEAARKLLILGLLPVSFEVFLCLHGTVIDTV